MATFGDNLCAGAGHCREQPVQAAFPRDELDLPAAILGDKFVMALGDAQNLVNRLNPLRGYFLFTELGGECLPQG